MANVRDVDDFVEQLSNCIGEISGNEVVFKKIPYSSEYVVRMRNHNEKVANIWYDYDKDKIIVQLIPAFRNMEYSLDDLTIENIKVIGQLVRKNALNRIGESMEIDEAKQILNKAGYYLCEFRDSSNPLDKETEERNWRYSDDEVSWNNVKARDRSNIKGEDTTKEDNAVAKMANSLISKVDEVCNRFEDYDYFVKRYDSNTIQIRTTEEKDTGVPFIQISVYWRDGKYKFCCGLGRVSQELRSKTYKDYTEVEDVLKWVSACLAHGYIN